MTNNNNNRCEAAKNYASIQQAYKKEPGDNKRKPVSFTTPIQAVYDSKTGASLEAILAQFNSIYVQYQGSPQATRNIIPEVMRRAGLTITYMDMESNTITERANSAVQKDNDHWGLDVNWSRVDELSLSGDISVSANGTWIINGKDTGVKALGPKGNTGLTPWLKTIDNKLHFSYDNVTWEPCSENIAAYFRFNATSSDSQAGTIGRIQISRDNKTWTDLSPEFRNDLRIQGYVATTSALPANQVVGTIYGVGPTYAAEDTAKTNPIYRLHVWNGTSWVDNGQFTSIAAGVVQETGSSETEVMSQKAVTENLSGLKRNLTTRLIENKESETKALSGVYNGIITGHLYRVYIRDNNWLPSNDNDSPLSFYYKKKDGSTVQLTRVSVGDTPKSYYDIQVLEEDADLLSVRFRLAPNTSVTYTISDITDTLLKNLQNEMILQQGGIDASKGTDVDNTNRVRSFNFIEPRTKLITQGDVVIWGLSYYDKTTKEFVTYENYKTQYLLTDSNYLARVVFAKGDGTQEIVPSDVFGNTLGVSLGEELVKFNEINNTQSTIRLVGKGDEKVFVNLRLVEDRIYRIFFVNNDWLYDEPISNKLYISHRVDETETGLITDATAYSDVKKEYIIKAEKALNDNRYQIIIRANEGEEVFVRVEDITESVKNLTQILLLEQGAIDTKSGSNMESKNTQRVRTSNYVPCLSVIYTPNAIIWGEALYDPTTLDFVDYNNIKSNFHVTNSYYVSRIVFAKDIDGISNLKPTDVFGHTIGTQLEPRLADDMISKKQIEMEEGLLYNLYTSAQADGLPSSLIGRSYINKATKTPLYISCKTSISISPQNNVCFIVFEYSKEGAFIGANYYQSTDDITIRGAYCKILALKGELSNPTLSNGSFADGGIENEATNRKRTDYISIDDFDFSLIERKQKLNFRAYDENLSFIPKTDDALPYLFISDNGLIAKEHIVRYYAGVKYVRFIVADEFDSDDPDVKVNLMKTNGLCRSIQYSTRGTVNTMKEFGIADKTIVISYPTIVNNPTHGEKYYSKILLRLPKNYSNTGKEVPLILFKTGADGFDSLSKYEFNYAYYIQYLVDQGFAVFDYHASTSKNPDTDNFGTPTGVYAAMNAYKYITEHYNVKKELFLACKSLGGNLTMLLSYSSLPVKAAGLLAPAMNPSGWCFGYTEEEQLAYAQDFGFKEGYETVLNGSRDYKRQEFKELVQENLDVLTGYQPMQLGITNKTFGETFVNQDVYDPDVEDSFKDIIRYVPVPIKFWVAPDDTNTPIQMHRNFVKSAINGGSTAYLRELPEGTGAHHAVDNDPNALQTTNITTRLGVHYDTMTTAWVELAEWFMKYGG